MTKRRLVRQLEVETTDLEDLYAEARALVAHHQGWITLIPVVPAEDEPPRSMGPIASLVGSSRYDVPVATWVPGSVGRRGAKPDALGIQHSQGIRVQGLLADHGVPVPPQWRLAQDHPRRGLIVHPPVGCPMEAMFPWLLQAAGALARRELKGRWRAQVHSAG